MVGNKSYLQATLCLFVLALSIFFITPVTAQSHSKYDWNKLIATVDQSSVRGKFLAGICYANTGFLGRAFNELQVGIEKQNREELKELLDENRQMVTTGASDLLTLNILAYGELILENLTESIKWFERIIAQDPDNVWPRNMVALLYGRRDNMDQAISHLKQALQIDPKNKYSHLLLAMGYKEQQQFGAAIYHYLQGKDAVRELRQYGIVK